jgi:diaminohydroxyphosphoribosylaminopyrimidine deaminase/5-amino-6-(5-phosphoribosylamino)uracil reductase
MPFPGKWTPPCAQAIVEAGISRVVVALSDPHSAVDGRGIAYLRELGVIVEVGDGAQSSLDLLRPFFKHRSTGLPYVIAKFAASLDGRTATNTGDSKWITGEAARERAHQERARVDAIIVGSGTILADDPELTARPGGRRAGHQPARVVVDSRGRSPAAARVFSTAAPVIVATTSNAPAGWRRDIAAAGSQIIECETAEGGLNLNQLLQVLGQRGVTTAWVEGGGTLLGSLFEAGLVDEVWAFIAPLIIGGDGLPAVGGHGPDLIAAANRLSAIHIETLGADVLIRGFVNATPAWLPERRV